MTEINAFKCDYCGKVYTTSKTCKAHEKNCYYNPTTRSCASCKHLELEKKYLSPGEYTKIQVCRAGVDIPKEGLQSGCAIYLEREDATREDVMSPELLDNNTRTSWQWFVSSSLRALKDNSLI